MAHVTKQPALFHDDRLTIRTNLLSWCEGSQCRVQLLDARSDGLNLRGAMGDECFQPLRSFALVFVRR